MTVLAIIAGLLVAAGLGASLILNMREWRWMADIETHEGRKKLDGLGYERLELVRLRPERFRRYYHTDSDYRIIPLDAPDRHARTTLETVAHGYFFRTDDDWDALRVYGWKDGVRHLVFKTYFSAERLRTLRTIITDMGFEA